MEDRNKFLTLTLACMVLGSFLFIFGVKMDSFVLLIVYYIIGLALNLVSLLALFRNKLNLKNLKYYLIFMDLAIIASMTYVFCSSL